MTANATGRVQDLIDSGERVLCPAGCGAVIIPGREQCPYCGKSTQPALATTPVAASTKRPKKATPAGLPKAKATPVNPSARRGSAGTLRDVPDHHLTFVVTGDPVSQGSMAAIAAGVARHENAAELKAWRDTITRHAGNVCGPAWVACNAPVAVEVTLTVPAGAALRAVTHADGYRDLDKLQRAIGDAMCPNDPAKHFRVLASDMRIVRWTAAKTYARPLHTADDALDQPGAVIRVTLAPPPGTHPDTPVPAPTCLP